MIDIDEIKAVTYKKSEVILFNSYSKTDSVVLSNHYPCKIEFGGYTFNSSEQLFFCLLLSEHPKAQKSIMACNDAKEVKTKGEGFIKRKGIKEDGKKCIDYLRFAIRLKYKCCSEFREFLKKNPDKRIVEYAPWGDDGYGAVDVDIRNKWNWYQGEVRGQNVCGRIISGIRKEALNGDINVEVPKGVLMYGEPLTPEGTQTLF